jgi:type I restriction enzyme S subunit
MLVKEFTTCNPVSTISARKLKYINYIDTASVVDGKLLGIKTLDSNYPSRAQRRIQESDILISSVRPILRHNYYVNKKIDNGIASTGFIQLRITTPNIANARFVYYWLTTNEKIVLYNSIAEQSQSTFPAFNKEVIGNLEFPDISLAQQQHIVDLKPLFVTIEN